MTSSKKNLPKFSTEKERLAAVDRDHPHLTIKTQCELLSVNRSSVYYEPKVRTVDEHTVDVMNQIDQIHTDNPTYGYRKITDVLRRDTLINKKAVQRLMREMGILAIYPKPNLSKRYHAQFVRPYLLRNLAITRPDQVWGIDITYIKMHKGFMYLFVIFRPHDSLGGDVPINFYQPQAAIAVA